MKHDHVLKKINLDLLTGITPIPGSGVGVCEQNFCYHAAAFSDSHLFYMQRDHVLKS